LYGTFNYILVIFNKKIKFTIDKFGKNNHNKMRKVLPDKSVSGGGMTIVYN